jgi:tetratricopeptide (TPR) repeat protein
MAGIGMRLAATLAIAIAAGPVMAQPASSQQQFEQASAALSAGRWAEALSGFEALEKRLAGSRSAQSLAVVRVRKGEALFGLGREEEARAAIALGLGGIPATDAGLREDRFLATNLLGRIAERNLDYGQAFARYREAEAIATTPAERGYALRGLVQTGMFVNAPDALAAADRAIAAVGSAPDKSLLAQMRTMRGRVLLNLGRHADARDELRIAVRLLGGLTMTVNAADLAARSDLSLALLLLGDEEGARQYLAYTGAGRTKEGLGFGAEMTPPACGEEGLEPQDVAVVEFSIRNDGSVGSVAPIYASKQGGSAVAFARAVQGWSWAPETVAKIPPLLRALTRVELRCSTASARPSLIDLLGDDLTNWLMGKQVAVPERSARALSSVDALKADLARQATGALPGLQSIPTMLALADHPAIGYAESAGYMRRALAAARAGGAPSSAEAYLKLRLAILEHRALESRRVLDLQPLFSDPVFMRDARAGAALRLMAEAQMAEKKDRERSRQVLRQVTSMPGLAPTDPLRVAALLRLSSVELAGGNTAGARSAFDATGLTGQQCALIDPGPAKASGNFSSSDFPNDALRWGFEGFTMIEHDILADGRVAQARPVIAYPPFVFGKAAAGRLARFRYDPSFRPDGSIGCGGKSQRIRFALPR